uniref:NADH dehydrogenase subunit 3 n=1 Tax=Conlopa bredoni TaxID=3112144 RepID=UPI002E7A70FA|nr:NADH dehydrogenase subunit 3 [Conlopa bredoni]WRK21433.1 NADH dehydrogenase subunit 3 [Conlopa bredoni]
MNLLMKSVMVSIILTTIMTIMSMMISMKKFNNKSKMSPFECGFNPMSKKRLPFSIHFFLISILFLIFDIEIVIIIPMILTLKISLMKYWMTTTMTFSMIMILSILFEWNKGLLNWSK